MNPVSLSSSLRYVFNHGIIKVFLNDSKEYINLFDFLPTLKKGLCDDTALCQIMLLYLKSNGLCEETYCTLDPLLLKAFNIDKNKMDGDEFGKMVKKNCLTISGKDVKLEEEKRLIKIVHDCFHNYNKIYMNYLLFCCSNYNYTNPYIKLLSNIIKAKPIDIKNLDLRRYQFQIYLSILALSKHYEIDINILDYNIIQTSWYEKQVLLQGLGAVSNDIHHHLLSLL